MVEPRRAATLRDALERVLASVVELDTGACDEISYGSRNEDFARLRKRRDSRSNVNGESCELVAVALTLAGV